MKNLFNNPKKQLWILFILAFCIRLIGLNQSLWLDEATSAQVVRNLSFWHILTKFSPNDFHPPLFYLFLKVWTSLFGTFEIMLRMPSVIFSLLAGWYVYLIGRLQHPVRSGSEQVSNETVGFWSAAFFLFNPLIIYYAQEARMYMMVTFLLTAALYYVLTAQRDKTINLRAVLLANIFIFLSFLTHYSAVFFIVAMYSYLLFNKQFRLVFYTLPGFIGSFALIAPLLYHQFVYSRVALKDVQNWSLVLGKVTAKNLFLIPLKFTSGRISFYPKILYYALAGGWMVVTLFFATLGGYKRRMIAVLFVLPLVFGTIFSFITPLLQYFRFLYLIPLLAILVAFGIAHIKKQWLHYVALAGFILFSLLYLTMPQFHREDWRSAASLVANYDPTESIYTVYMIPTAADPLNYYLKSQVHIQDIRSIPVEKLSGPLIVVPYAAEIYGLDYTTPFTKAGWKKVETHTYRGVPVEVWKK